MYQNTIGGNSEVNASPISDTISAVQDILAHSRVIISDLETPYSIFPKTNHSAVRRNKSINAVVSERQQRLDAVLQEVSEMDSTMDRIKNIHLQLLKKKDNVIVQSMDSNSGLVIVSALWRFPSELLSLIFVHCLPKTEHLLPSSKLAPMLLTRICRRWREVATGISSLWSRVIVDINSEDWQRTAFCYDVWLKRSRDRPLSLALKCFKNNTTYLRSLLEPHTNQISSLHIILFVNPFTAELLLNDLPVLQELTITAPNPLWCTPSLAQSISRLPFTLRRLIVAGPSAFDFDRIISCNPVWAHLTHVEIAICQPNLILQLLQLGPNFSSLEIGLSFYDGVSLAFEPFTHKNLQSLCISNASPMRMENVYPDLFNALTLPNLRLLEARYIRPWPHEELKTFLTRSSCPLESLIFGTGVTTTDEQRGEYVILVPFLDVVVDPKRGDYCGYRRLTQRYGTDRRGL